MSVLHSDEIARRLEKLPGWHHRGNALEKHFDRRNFDGSLAFVNAVAKAANEQNHHPDVTISWNDVALTLDLKIVALGGSTSDGNPILDNRSYSGVVTVRKDTGVVLVSELDKSETRAISGLPEISEIPGLNSVSDNTKDTNSSTLVVILTPHVVRGTQAAGHSPMMRIERGGTQ